MGREVRFAPTQPMPPGYRVVWLGNVEHYIWRHDATDRDSDITCDRFAARRGAWADYRRANDKEKGR